MVVFAGGGYGAGKTTAMTFLAKAGVLGIGHGDMRGVDYCKMLLPEFERIKMVCDGRASSVCQDESRVIADALFPRLVQDRRSFGWDSSMSNQEETLKKINLARSAGYKLCLVAVWAPTEIAIHRAMRRARETKRFAHPDHLAPSAKQFAEHFPLYVDCFDEVMLFDNSEDGDPDTNQPILIAEKKAVEMELEVYDDERVQRFFSFGESV